MNESERLAAQLDRGLNGEAWHGPAWRELLEDVPRAAALRRPVPAAHSIAEIVRHVTTWHDVVRRRLEGESPDVTEAQNWPEAALPDDAAWAEAAGALLRTGRALGDVVRRFPAERLHETRPGVAGSWFELIAGVLQHDLYHAGQVAILRKAEVPDTVPAQ